MDDHKEELEKKHQVWHWPRVTLDRMYDLAYEYGHSHGKDEIENYYIDLVEFVPFVVKNG